MLITVQAYKTMNDRVRKGDCIITTIVAYIFSLHRAFAQLLYLRARGKEFLFEWLSFYRDVKRPRVLLDYWNYRRVFSYIFFFLVVYNC